MREEQEKRRREREQGEGCDEPASLQDFKDFTLRFTQAALDRISSAVRSSLFRLLTFFFETWFCIEDNKVQ
jgi:hypothetical protein